MTSIGCKCPCKCKNCQLSFKYLNLFGEVATNLPNVNEEGCVCALDKLSDVTCEWVNCQVKCRNCLSDLSCNDDNKDNGQTIGGWSDVHFATLDHNLFDFQGFGEYTFCRDLSNDFDVQIRTFWIGQNYRISYIGGVAIKLYDSKLTVFLQKSFTYKIRLDENVLDYSAPQQFVFGNIILKTNQNGISVVRAFHSSIDIILNSQFINLRFKLLPRPYFFQLDTFEGICGNWDSNKYNDYQGPDGILYANANEFVYSWRLNNRSTSANSTKWDYEKIFIPTMRWTTDFMSPQHENVSRLLGR